MNTTYSIYKLPIIFLSTLIIFSIQAQATEGALKNESEVGMVITTGNSQTQTISAKDQTTYKFDQNSLRFDGRFLTASTSGVESAYRWLLGLRYDRELTERFGIYVGQSLDQDKFQNILQRYNTDIGGKYSFYKEDAFKWFAELGYRFTRTNYVGFFLNENYMRAYTEAERFFNKSVSMKFWFEYLPNITEWRAYKFNTELSLSAALSDIFSVKTGYLLRYDNKPAPAIRFNADSTFTTALVAKF